MAKTLEQIMREASHVPPEQTRQEKEARRKEVGDLEYWKEYDALRMKLQKEHGGSAP